MMMAPARCARCGAVIHRFGGLDADSLSFSEVASAGGMAWAKRKECPVKRIRLPEIEDQAWCPAWLRDAMTGYLTTVVRTTRPYAVVTPVLAGLVRASGAQRVVDLASGAGGPWPDLMDDVGAEGERIEVMLSDLHPNLRAAEELERVPGVRYRREPVSALAVPNELEGVRTLFTALHHLDPEEVRALFRDAQDAGAPFLAAEASHRSLRGLLAMLFVPVLVLLLMPRVRPRRALPLLLTYLPPLLPLVIWWDGLASTLKSYRVEELNAITEEVQRPEYQWQVAELRVRGAPIPVTVVVGRPRGAARRGLPGVSDVRADPGPARAPGGVQGGDEPRGPG